MSFHKCPSPSELSCRITLSYPLCFSPKASVSIPQLRYYYVTCRLTGLGRKRLLLLELMITRRSLTPPLNRPKPRSLGWVLFILRPISRLRCAILESSLSAQAKVARSPHLTLVVCLSFPLVCTDTINLMRNSLPSCASEILKSCGGKFASD